MHALSAALAHLAIHISNPLFRIAVGPELAATGGVVAVAVLAFVNGVVGAQHAAPQDCEPYRIRRFLARAAGCADMNELPEDIRDIIRPFLPGRFARPAAIQAALSKATRLINERERHARHQARAVYAQNDHALAEARAAHIAGLTEEERALLALRIDAETHAAGERERLVAENTALSRRINELEQELAAVRAAEGGG